MTMPRPVDGTWMDLPTASPVTVRDMVSARPRRLTGGGYLFTPPSLRPGRAAPGVVVMEGLGGLKPHRELAYGAWLAAEGYVALVVDSFGPRGMGAAAHNRRALTVTESALLADAHAALHALRRHPAVDGQPVGVMGFSYGGMISVLCAYEQIRRAFAVAPDDAFAAHASYYGCSVPRLDDPTATGAPVAMDLGELDANVSLRRSEAIADDLRRGGAAVDLLVHPGVYHQWDGDDVTLRHVSYALDRLAMRLGPDNHIRDERTGLRVRGLTSRAAAILLGARRSGYHILRDPAATERTNARTLALFGRMRMPGAARRAAG